MNLPNLLTLVRILCVPIFVVVYLIPGAYIWAAAVFTIAAITDALDGYLARRWEQTTAFGAFLDPVADKLIVVSALALLIGSYNSVWMTLPGLIIIGREVVISALREWMAEMNRRGLVRVSWVGKVKTVLQMISIIILAANPPFMDRPWVIVGYILMYVAVILTLWSMALYVKAAWPTLLDGMKES
ncbi:MAG: CDP-diacylglycerol--glycerol-3-phosphate 3-phosphatidyltransferase [Pseudomonadales bacterium]|nr:CDP-diacylglycerol--glycerol-3-phosphate 3-phosphatidyltransferase [Pseudomonadales bacterium]